MFYPGEYYVCNAITQKVIAGPFQLKHAVSFIDAQPQRQNLCTKSRHAMAKEKLYPRNAKGEESLASDCRNFLSHVPHS